MARLKVVFYALPLKDMGQHNAFRSGIALSSYHILLHLAQICDVVLFADVEHYEICKRQCQSIESLAHFKFIGDYGWFLRLISKICYFKFYCKSHFGGTFRDYLGRALAFPAVLISRHTPLSKRTLKKISQNDVIFSPYHALPKQIMSLNMLRFMLLHDVIPLINKKDYAMSNKIIDKLLRKLLRTRHDFYDIVSSLNTHDYYISNSAFTKNDFLRLCGDKLKASHISVALLGVDRAYFHPHKDLELNLTLREKYHIPKNMRYIFSLCSLDPRKNLLFVIENVLETLARFWINDVVLVLAGGAWEGFVDILEAKIASFGARSQSIIRIGYVDDTHLANLFSCAMCSIYLSTYEGFGLPVLESMSCGCPTIASNTTSIPEVLGDGGIALHPQDALGLQEAIYRIYSEPQYASLLSQKALARASLFSWEQCAQDILHAFMRAKADRGEVCSLFTKNSNRDSSPSVRAQNDKMGKVDGDSNRDSLVVAAPARGDNESNNSCKDSSTNKDIKSIHRIFFGFGGEEDIYRRYVQNWQEQLPDFEIIFYNASNLPLGVCEYTKALSKLEDGVFLGDYYRWYLLYHYGGVYFDADIEVYNGAKFRALIDELQSSQYEMIIGIEDRLGGYTSHAMAAKKGARLAKFMCELYEGLGKLYLLRKEILISPKLVGLYFMANGHYIKNRGFVGDISEPCICEGVKIYPKTYFSPLSIGAPPKLEDLSPSTCLAHHCASSWWEEGSRFYAQKLSFASSPKLLADYIALEASMLYKIKTLPKRLFIALLFPHGSKRRAWAKVLATKLIHFGLR